MSSSTAPPEPPAPPKAKPVPTEFRNFGDTRVDNYYYLRNRDNPDTMAYIKAENAYADAFFQPVQALVDKVYGEILGRIKQTDMAPPYPHGGYFYYTRTVEGLNYPIYCRRKGSLDAPEEVMFDVNALAKGHKFYSLGGVDPDPAAHRLCLFATDTTGYREYVLQVKNLETGEILPDRMERTAGAAWAADGRHIFYIRQQPRTKRSYQVWRHALGAPGAEDQLVYEETDDRFRLDVARALSGDYILIGSESGRTSEVRYLDARKPLDTPRVFLPRQEGITYSVTPHGSRFFVVINDTGRNFRVASAPLGGGNPGDKSKWTEIIPAAGSLYVEGMIAFRNHAVYQLRLNGLHTLRVQDLRESGKTHDIAFDEQAYAAGIGRNAEFDTATLRFAYTSMITPQSVYDYDLNARTRVLVKRQEVLGGYDPSQYAVERVMIPSHDGVKVPLTIAYRKGFRKDGAAPALLYGYGAYAIPMDPTFSVSRLSLLDRGFVYAIGHIRGGTDMGYTWYEDGKLLRKKNTFRDFVACAEWLIANRYTSAAKLAIEGGSAGGLLVGAAMNARPDLFRAVVAAVPFVDVINSLSDETIPLTTTDADEFGSPKRQEFYEYMKGYSPYENTRPARYPWVYIFSSMNDSQVPYWEPVKWAARLRDVNQGDGRIVLRMNMDAGHGGASGRYERFREIAQAYAFVLAAMGIGR